MQEIYFNEVKAKLKRKEKVSCAWLHMASNVSAEIMANAGFDVLLIDAEHSPVDYQTMLSMCQAIKAAGVVPFARAPWNDLISIKKICDCGVMGISVPYVNTAEEACEAVRRCKYPPFGIRGIAGSPRASGYGMNRGKYLQNANDQNLVMVAIETVEGIDNLPEIMKTEELDGIFIGPMDLSTSMGMMGQISSQEVQAQIHRIEEIVLSSEKFLATVANDVEHAKTLYEKGYNLIVMMSDVVDLSKMAHNTVHTFQEYLAQNTLPNEQ
ncbi:MAG: aldolase/citrate lyase family protein [Anaerovorax sp.]